MSEDAGSAKEGRAESGFASELQKFHRQLDSIRTTLPLLGVIVTANYDVRSDAVQEFAKEHEIESREDEGGTTYSVPQGLFREFRPLLREFEAAGIARRVVPTTFVVALVSLYDAFLGSLVRVIFEHRPDLLRQSERKLSYADLADYETLDDARESIVEKEVEALLRESHTKQFDWLEAKLEMPLRKGLDAWPVFVELTERRNLFVHTDGVISAHYMRTCREAGADLAAGDCKQGKRLYAPRDYFLAACDCLFEISTKLTHVIWRKLEPDERIRADGSLNGICHDLIAERREELALELLVFATEVLKTHANEEMRLYFLLNKAQALKWLERGDECQAILDREDWTAKSVMYQLVRAVLRDEFDKAASYVRRIGAGGEVGKEDYSTWAIFREFRQSAEFAAVYEEVFGEPFQVEEQAHIEQDDEDGEDIVEGEGA